MISFYHTPNAGQSFHTGNHLQQSIRLTSFSFNSIHYVMAILIKWANSIKRPPFTPIRPISWQPTWRYWSIIYTPKFPLSRLNLKNVKYSLRKTALIDSVFKDSSISKCLLQVAFKENYVEDFLDKKKLFVLLYKLLYVILSIQWICELSVDEERQRSTSPGYHAFHYTLQSRDINHQLRCSARYHSGTAFQNYRVLDKDGSSLSRFE